jgi:Tol biopolymer transport system component
MSSGIRILVRTRRGLVLAVLVVVALVATTGFLLQRRAAREGALASATAVATVPASALAGQPRLLFRHTGLGATYGRVAMVALADTNGPRAFLDPSCERLYAVPTRTICVYRNAGVVTTYRADVGDGDFRNSSPLPVPGLPSRARLSSDGALVATTSFVTGDSYLSSGFSTRTYVTDLRTGASSHLEDFAVVHEGQTMSPADRNLWGVTFAADDRTFYVTVSWGGATWLARGDLTARTVTTLAANVECPSLSPDETRLAFKKRVGPASDPWRVMIRDLASGVETAVAETRSVDDQMAWLDDATIAYAVPRTAPGVASSDIWSVRADGTGEPQLIVRDAFSPAAIR